MGFLDKLQDAIAAGGGARTSPQNVELRPNNPAAIAEAMTFAYNNPDNPEAGKIIGGAMGNPLDREMKPMIPLGPSKAQEQLPQSDMTTLIQALLAVSRPPNQFSPETNPVHQQLGAQVGQMLQGQGPKGFGQ